MGISKPYKRIYRPAYPLNSHRTEDEKYQYDPRFIDPKEESSMMFSAKLIINDLETLFEYVEPTDANNDAFSHRIYELFLRVCTEFEANCKGILSANGYNKDKMNIIDYYKIIQVSKLVDYVVVCNKWYPYQEFCPFEEWKNGHSLTWYQEYNEVKHNRSKNFNKANLKNLMLSVGALLCVIHMQIGSHIAYLLESNWYFAPERDHIGAGYFTIFHPVFTDDERYCFNWKVLKDDPDAFVEFQFN